MFQQTAFPSYAQSNRFSSNTGPAFGSNYGRSFLTSTQNPSFSSRPSTPFSSRPMGATIGSGPTRTTPFGGSRTPFSTLSSQSSFGGTSQSPFGSKPSTFSPFTPGSTSTPFGSSGGAARSPFGRSGGGSSYNPFKHGTDSYHCISMSPGCNRSVEELRVEAYTGRAAPSASSSPFGSSFGNRQQFSASSGRSAFTASPPRFGSSAPAFAGSFNKAPPFSSGGTSSGSMFGSFAPKSSSPFGTSGFSSTTSPFNTNTLTGRSSMFSNSSGTSSGFSSSFKPQASAFSVGSNGTFAPKSFGGFSTSFTAKPSSFSSQSGGFSGFSTNKSSSFLSSSGGGSSGSGLFSSMFNKPAGSSFTSTPFRGNLWNNPNANRLGAMMQPTVATATSQPYGTLDLPLRHGAAADKLSTPPRLRPMRQKKPASPPPRPHYKLVPSSVAKVKPRTYRGAPSNPLFAGFSDKDRDEPFQSRLKLRLREPAEDARPFEPPILGAPKNAETTDVDKDEGSSTVESTAVGAAARSAHPSLAKRSPTSVTSPPSSPHKSPKANRPPIVPEDCFIVPSPADALREGQVINWKKVKYFTIVRPRIGSVKFLGESDVSGLDLRETVKFSRASARHITVEVYPPEHFGKTGRTKPSVGTELNKPATITFFDCPRVKKDNKLGGIYDERDRTFTFSVDHF